MRGKQRGQPAVFFCMRERGVFLLMPMLMTIVMHMGLRMDMRLRVMHHAVHQP